MKNLTIVTISVLALALMPGCESDSSSSSSSSSSNTDAGTTGGATGTADGSGFTGLDGTLVMSDLTDEQQVAACEGGTAHLTASHNHEDMTKAMCLMTGMMAGMMDITCDEAYDACMADPQPMEEDDCADSIDDLSACTDITVAEVEACILAQWAQQEEMFAAMAAMTCADLESADPEETGGMMEEPETPAACEGLDEKCPVFFSDDEDMDDMGNMDDMGDMDDMDDMDGDDMDGDDM